MRPYESLGKRGQVGRLRRLEEHALARYGLVDAAMSLLQHEHNTTFRIDTSDGRYALRITRPGVQTLSTIESEMAWLRALCNETALAVPQPMPAQDGSLVVIESDDGITGPRACALLRWINGRFVADRLTPPHLRQVANLAANLHLHSQNWLPPEGFARPRIDTLTNEGKRSAVFGCVDQALALEHPTDSDADSAMSLVAELVSAEDAVLVTKAVDHVRAATRDISGMNDAFGLIHGDLHQENYLFYQGVARAIDFDDCGWGFYMYDLAVTLFEVEHLDRYEELRAAFLVDYASRRSLPRRYASYLQAFGILLRLQMLCWVVESREHAAFRDTWQDSAHEGLRDLAEVLDRADHE